MTAKEDYAIRTGWAGSSQLVNSTIEFDNSPLLYISVVQYRQG
jgi:hypothetical protein